MVRKYVNKRIDQTSSILGLDVPYFIKGGFWLLSSMILTSVGGIFLSSLFSRIWPSDVYGQFSFLMSALGFVSLTALPGMGQALTQAVGEGKDGSYKVAVKQVVRWSMLGVLLLICGSIYFFFRQNQNLALATFVSAVAFPISSASSLSISFLTGKKNFKMVAIFSIVFQYSSILATAFALWQFPSLVLVAFFSAWSTAIAGILLTIVAYREIMNEKIDPTTESLGKHLSFSQIFTIMADYFDRFLIPLLLGFSTNAIYAFAILIPTQLHNFFKVFLGLGQPKIAVLNEKRLFRDLIVKSLQLEILVAFLVCAYIISAPLIFKFLYPSYQGSATLISQIFSISLLYYPFNLFGLGLIKQRRTKTISFINILYAGFSLLTLVTLVPSFGLVGAVIAKITVRFLLAGMLIYFSKKLYNHVS